MVDQKLISDWNRNQGAYEQARYFTPGKHENEVRTTHQGEPRTLDLLVVVHNDVEPAGPGQSRVDLIVDQGVHTDRPQFTNGHLVNNYDSASGVTDHTAVYDKETLDRIQGAAGGGLGSQDLPDRRDGVPGALMYSVRAKVKENENGEFVIDTDHPIESGKGVDRYTLHDQQILMRRSAEEQGLPAPGTVLEAETDEPEAPQQSDQPVVPPIPSAPPRPHPQQPSPPRSGAPVPPSSQSGLSAVRVGASMSGAQVPTRTPGKTSKTPVTAHENGVGLRGDSAKRVHQVGHLAEPRGSKTPSSEQSADRQGFIDRVPSQEELSGSGRGEAEKRSFEAQEGESTASAVGRGFTQGLGGAVVTPGSQQDIIAKARALMSKSTDTSPEADALRASLDSYGRSGPQAEQDDVDLTTPSAADVVEKVSGPDLRAERMNRMPWLREMMSDSQQDDQAGPVDPGFERD